MKASLAVFPVNWSKPWTWQLTGAGSYKHSDCTRLERTMGEGGHSEQAMPREALPAILDYNCNLLLLSPRASSEQSWGVLPVIPTLSGLDRTCSSQEADVLPPNKNWKPQTLHLPLYQ